MIDICYNWLTWLFPSQFEVFMCCPVSTAGQMEHRKAREPSNKRVKPLSRVTSLANLIPPVKTTPLKRFSQTLQRSISFRSESRPDILAPRAWSRNATSSSTKRRDSKLWSETFDVCVNQVLTAKEIKRQEAIFELSQGEEDLIEDLKLAKKAYHDPMLKLSIMTEQELNQIFGTLDSLIPLHEELLSQLRDVRKPDGSTEHVGPILVGWLPCLSSYDSYCSNQVAAKALLDHKKQDHRVQDFLQRCLESPFSRKLDLWNFLDIPRSRLVKYPLLLREILRHTPNDNPDQQHLEEAINIIQGIVAEINTKTGESECRYYKERLLYLEEGQKDSLIDSSRVLCCHGELKNNRGVKLHVFLFQEVLVITRAVTHNEQLCYQLYRQPIPVKDLTLEDLQDGELKTSSESVSKMDPKARPTRYKPTTPSTNSSGSTVSVRPKKQFCLLPGRLACLTLRDWSRVPALRTGNHREKQNLSRWTNRTASRTVVWTPARSALSVSGWNRQMFPVQTVGLRRASDRRL
ncbi:rho guanine nucleotide exchange factor 3 isoform X10 [Arvicanthis niloticus]|uniref:rho guanine nucleotide exchange factor 3 isoform X10 n=1 Tax=Arvicanthis niloticus TaxID=61156 RepID=UPI00402B24B0